MQTMWRLRGFLHGVWHRALNALRRRSGINPTPRDVPVVVSLTSHPPRLSTVFLAVESLLNQSFQPDRIVLWLSRAEVADGDIQNELRGQQQRGLEIRMVDENLSCYKKLIHALEEFPDCHIVTADDDFMFPRHWLRDLHRAHCRHPNAIAAHRGYWCSRRAARELRPYNLWLPADNATAPSHDIFPTCGAGAWFPPHVFSARITDRAFMQLAPGADDVWYKAHALLADAPVVMARARSVTFPMIYARGSQTKTLWQVNERANDAHLQTVFEHFALYDMVSQVGARDALRVNLYGRRGRRRKRLFDIVLATVCLPLLALPMALIGALIKLTSRGDALYWSKRVGRGGEIFRMPKFRTLKPLAAGAHNKTAAREYEFLGKFLRYTSIDELPQLLSILKGDMSFVGPRPIEPVESGLIALRAANEIDSLAPGLTGWAQVNGRDLLGAAEKVDFDLQYLCRQSLWLDIKILFITVVQVMRRENISF